LTTRLEENQGIIREKMGVKLNKRNLKGHQGGGAHTTSKLSKKEKGESVQPFRRTKKDKQTPQEERGF